jgi:malonyl-CoA decarboxylase
MASVISSSADPVSLSRPRSWLERLWSSVADRGRAYAEVLRPSLADTPLARSRELASALVSERGEASGAAIARELLEEMPKLGAEDRLGFYRFLVTTFLPPEPRLREAIAAYLAEPTPVRAAELALAAEPTRQELLRRINMAPGGTAALIAMREDLHGYLRTEPGLKPLDSDLRHLLASWFNRGFLELRRIDWQSPAAILEKLIAHEAVHEIQGWDDLRRRLAPDRRCFGFFHPALPGEPLIFVEVALTQGLAAAIQPLLAREDDAAAERARERTADTAIFYSISNCQSGLRGISFGNFLIKQVVEELKVELPGLIRFSTLSPVPTFRRHLDEQLASGDGEDLLRPDEVASLRRVAPEGAQAGAQDRPPSRLLQTVLGTQEWWMDAKLAEAVRAPLIRLCAADLTASAGANAKADPVMRFHLGNGARLEHINWPGNTAPRGIWESYGIMVNYLYDPEQIEANHEAFVRGKVVRSAAVDALLGAEPLTSTRPPQGSQRARRARKGAIAT